MANLLYILSVGYLRLGLDFKSLVKFDPLSDRVDLSLVDVQSGLTGSTMLNNQEVSLMFLPFSLISICVSAPPWTQEPIEYLGAVVQGT